MNSNPHEELKEIRSLMERSTRFMSLSGWTGIMAGIYSLLGATAAYFVLFNNGRLKVDQSFARNYSYEVSSNPTDLFNDTNLILLLIAIIVIVLSAGTAFFQSSIKAKKQNVKLWNSTTQRLFVQVAIPLVAGGLFCIALVYYGNMGLVAPAMLIFYGMALLNGSKYTLKEFHSLAVLEIVLGIVSMFFIGYGLYFWAVGFGVLHIIYGILMQKRYK